MTQGRWTAFGIAIGVALALLYRWYRGDRADRKRERAEYQAFGTTRFRDARRSNRSIPRMVFRGGEAHA